MTPGGTSSGTTATPPGVGDPSIRAVFERCGLRLTRQREAIYRALRSCHSHPTAEEIHRLVHDGQPMSLATVYNALQAFCTAGLCRKLATTDGSSRYDGGTRDHVHVNIAETGEVIDLPEDLSEELLSSVSHELLERVAAATGVTIDRVSLVLCGHAAPRARMVPSPGVCA